MNKALQESIKGRKDICYSLSMNCDSQELCKLLVSLRRCLVDLGTEPCTLSSWSSTVTVLTLEVHQGCLCLNKLWRVPVLMNPCFCMWLQEEN